MSEYNSDILALTSDIVSAHVGNNSVATSDLPTLIQSVYSALTATSAPAAPEAPKQEPAVSVRSSIKHDYLVCLEDGKKLKMLKRYLRTNYDMSPEEYRAKWDLPRDYPMVAPAYAAQRGELAKKIGLGRKKVVETGERIANSAGEALEAAHERLSAEPATSSKAPAKSTKAPAKAAAKTPAKKPTTPPKAKATAEPSAEG